MLVGATRDDDESSAVTGLAYDYAHAVEPDEQVGIYAGYGAKEVPLLVEGEVIGSRFVICHMVHTGRYSREYDIEGRCVDKQEVAYFSVEDSTLNIIEDRDAHDINRLRAVDDPVFRSIDYAVFDDKLEVSDKLVRIQETLEQHRYTEMSVVQQQEIVSYLNSLGLLKTLNQVSGEYAIRTTDDSNFSIIVLEDKGPCFMTFDGFTTSQMYLIGDTTAMCTGFTIGIKAQSYTETEKTELILPLNQSLKIA
jgi:hypothetical protein